MNNTLLQPYCTLLQVSIFCNQEILQMQKSDFEALISNRLITLSRESAKTQLR